MLAKNDPHQEPSSAGIVISGRSVVVRNNRVRPDSYLQ